MNNVLSTTKDLLDFIRKQSYFIEDVRIEKVEPLKFTFSVQLPMWYKFLFGYFLKRTIQKELSNRIPIGVLFDFYFYSKNFM